MTYPDTLENLIFARKLINPNPTPEYLHEHIGKCGYSLEEIKEALERE